MSHCVKSHGWNLGSYIFWFCEKKSYFRRVWYLYCLNMLIWEKKILEIWWIWHFFCSCKSCVLLLLFWFAQVTFLGDQLKTALQCSPLFQVKVNECEWMWDSSNSFSDMFSLPKKCRTESHLCGVLCYFPCWWKQHENPSKEGESISLYIVTIEMALPTLGDLKFRRVSYT